MISYLTSAVCLPRFARAGRIAAVAVVLFAAAAAQVLAGDEWRFTFEKKAAVDRDEKKDETMGKGTSRMEKLSFESSVTYGGIDAIKGVTITYYIIAVSNGWDRKTQKYYLAGKFPNEAQEFGSGNRKDYTMGPIAFPEFETRNKNTNMLWRGGVKYEGWVVEVSKDGKVLSRQGRTPELIKKVENNELIENVDFTKMKML